MYDDFQPTDKEDERRPKPNKDERVTELFLCEAYRITLKPNILYRFVATAGCDDCARLADEAQYEGPGI